MNLSKNFTLEEFTFSQTATRQSIDNSPGPAIIISLARVATTLEQIRALVGKPVSISSGYRSPALNRAVGGAPDSAHMHGLAADISMQGYTPVQLARLIRDSGIEFDQLIYEGAWVHIGLSADAPRRDVLTAIFDGGRARYVQGIA